MPVNKTAIRAGKKFEPDLMKYLREQEYDVERLRLTGAEDEGDLLLRIDTPYHFSRYVIEAKREKGFHIGGWIKEAETERFNYAKHRGINASTVSFVVVHHARGKGIGQAYVTTTLDEWLRTL